MNNKGQALVEFVLILPIFILILFVIIDFGMIINTKSSLENKSVDIVEFVKNDKTIEEINSLYDDIQLDINYGEDYIKIIIYSDVDIITPGLNRILGDPYLVKVERVIYNEDVK